jgi:hypothetical protein
MRFHREVDPVESAEFSDGAAYLVGPLRLRLSFAPGRKNQSSLRMTILNGRELND